MLKLSLLLNNRHFVVISSIVLILYSVVIAPNLPKMMMNFVNNPVTKSFLLGLVIMVSTSNSYLALLLLTSLLVSMQDLSKITTTLEDMYRFQMSAQKKGIEYLNSGAEILTEGLDELKKHIPGYSREDYASVM